MSDVPDDVLVVAAQGGDDRAFAELFDRWFDRVYDVAWRIVHDRETAREVAQEVFLAAWRRLASIEQPASFGGWLLRTSRNQALNRLARERRSVALGDEETAMEIDRKQTGGDDPTAPIERGEHVDLVWAAAAALGERDTSLLDLHLRHGLGAPELAEALGVTPNNAHQLLFRLKGKLATAIRAWVLWQDGSPACPGLGRALGAAGVTRFGAEAVKVTGRHLPGCEACQERQQTRLAPEAMFAAVPLVGVGAAIKAEAASALAAQGVPTGAPSALAGASPGEGGPGEGAGPGGAGGGEAGSGSASGAARTGVRVAVAVAVLALVVGVVAVVLADPLGHGTRDAELDVAAETATTRAGPTTTALPVTQGAAPAPADGAPAPEEPAVAAPGPTTTEAPARPEAPADPGTGGEDPVPPPDTTLPPPPPPPAPPPTVGGFRATATTGGTCPSTTRTITLVWQTTGADAVALSGPGAPGGGQPPDGTAVACAPVGGPAATYQLVATGPGGTATRTATA